MEHMRVSIIEKTAKEQTQALLNKEISAKELLDETYKRIEQVEPKVQSYNCLTKELAYETAKKLMKKSQKENNFRLLQVSRLH